MSRMRAYDFVTNTPLRLDEHRVLALEDVALVRTSPPLSPHVKASIGRAMVERCVVVHRTTEGYGFTVTGENPVYVQMIKPNGPAHCAGVRQGDRILKVNGMPVTASNQQEVVRMISGGQNVVLTLLGKPLESLPFFNAPDLPTDTKLSPDNQFEGGKDDWKRRRKELLGQMLDDERRHVEDLRTSSENGEKIEKSRSRIVSLQSQLRNVEEEGRWNQPSTAMDLDSEDEENEYMVPNENSGPFANLAKLKEHPAHMAVFINHLLNNASPNSLFYYIITDGFTQTAQGNAKEYRRWAFEIFTTFIIPNSPMCIPNSDQSIIQPIDKVLSTTMDHITDSDIETLKRVFVPGRNRAVQDINEHLNDFRQKLQLGLGTVFDANQLSTLARGDAAAETKAGEQILFRALENIAGSSSDFDSCDLKTQATIATLATIIRLIIGKPSSSTWDKLLDRYPQLLQKDRSGKPRKPPSSIKTKTQVKGHSFVFNQINTVHYCYQCRDAVWGLLPWCYFCNNCDVKVHAQCTSSLADACYPVSQGKSKGVLKGRKLLGKSDHDDDDSRLDHGAKSTSSDSGIGQDIHDKTTVGRSQSMKQMMSHPDEQRTPQKSRHATTWGNDLPLAEEEEDYSVRGVGIRKRSIDGRSEARSFEGNSRFMSSDLQSISGSSGISQLSHHSMPESEVKRMVERINAQAIAEGDSDMEVESETPALDQLVGWDVVKHLKPKEKKRQDFINELFHTERTHVRNLKILMKLFYKPMLTNNVVSPEVLSLLFANLEQLIDVHSKMSRKMREACEMFKRDPTLHGPFGDIGSMVEGMFLGEEGDRLMQVTSVFCQHQQHALEILRSKIEQKKDKEDSLSRFLAEAESHPICRKLQLKDMIPVEMQRLVKYPLLLEGIAKYTNEPSEELECILRAVTAAKRTLIAVNTAKRNAENLRRLEELQRKMDTTPFERENLNHDLLPFDLTKYQLIHDGPLTCRFNKSKTVEFHVILLEQYLIFLTKASDGTRLLLKSLEPTKEQKWSPIVRLAPLIAKEKANDKRAFFLVWNNNNGAQIFELVAATATERKTWFKLMSDQIENDKKHQRQGYETPFEVTTNTTDNSDGMAKVHVLTHPRLVNASEITIQQPTVLEHAQPVLTPIERLKRSDDAILQALLMKEKILAEFLAGDKKGKTDELEKLTELLGGLAVADLKQRDSKELAMSAIVHGNRLLDSINNAMKAHKESDDTNSGQAVLVLDDNERHLPGVPCYKLTAIAAPLMNHLKALMQVILDQQNEVAALRQQVYHYKELLETGQRDRSVSEETLTECSGDPMERKLMTKRQRTPSIQPVT